MRIVAGEKRRLKLECPRGAETRPTLERVRESLFAHLEPLLRGARVLDLFAGAGTLGLEALSRGAACATFVESSRPALQALKANLQRLDLSERAAVVPEEVFRFISRGPRRPYDLILADPPYGQSLAERLLARIARRPERWLAPEGRLVLQVGRRDKLDPAIAPLERTLERLYGETRLEIFALAAQAAPAFDPEESSS